MNRRAVASASSISARERLVFAWPCQSEAAVIGAEIAAQLVPAACERAKGENGEIEYRVGDVGDLDEAHRAELCRDLIAFHDGFPAELGICVPREYRLLIGARR